MHSESAERELLATLETRTETTSSLLPPPFDVAELGNYASAGGNQEVSFTARIILCGG